METLAIRFDRSMRGYHQNDHPKATAFTIRRIEAHFGLLLPPEFVQLAKNSKRFGCFFLSFGSDFSDPDHVIHSNSYWRRRRRTRRLPKNYVIASDGFMDEEFWCFVKSDRPGINMPIAFQYWSPAPIGYPKGGILGERFATFNDFIEDLLKAEEAATSEVCLR